MSLGSACMAVSPSLYNTGLLVVSMYVCESISVQHWSPWCLHVWLCVHQYTTLVSLWPVCMTVSPSVYNTGISGACMSGCESISVQHWSPLGPACQGVSPSVYNTCLLVVSIYGCENISILVQHWSPWGLHVWW